MFVIGRKYIRLTTAKSVRNGQRMHVITSTTGTSTFVRLRLNRGQIANKLVRLCREPHCIAAV